MQTRSIRPDEQEICLDLLSNAFENTRREYFKRYFDGDPWTKPEYTRLVEDNGDLVSVVQICRRDVRYGDQVLSMGGIANVGTPPEFRGKGYSTEALKSSIEVMTDDKMDFSILFTGINAYYVRLGWTTIDTIQHSATLKDSLNGLDVPYTVRPFSDADVDAVVDIYNEFNANIPLTAIRTPDYWSGFVNTPQSVTFEIFIAESDGIPVAYLAGNGHKETFGIAEMCCLNGHETALVALAREAYDRAKELGLSKFVHRMPNVESINTALLDVSEPLSSVDYPYVMFRIIDMHGMFTKVLTELSKRSIGLKGGGQITIGVTGFADVTLDIAPGQVSFLDQASDSRVDLSQRDFWALFFGFKQPDEVLPAVPGADLLAAIFPKQPSVYYLADGF